MIKCICDYINKKKLERLTENWDTCFFKNVYISYGVGMSHTTYNTWQEIKYSGRSNKLDDNITRYECLKNGKIEWIDASELRFPVHLNEPGKMFVDRGEGDAR